MVLNLEKRTADYLRIQSVIYYTGNRTQLLVVHSESAVLVLLQTSNSRSSTKNAKVLSLEDQRSVTHMLLCRLNASDDLRNWLGSAPRDLNESLIVGFGVEHGNKTSSPNHLRRNRARVVMRGLSFGLGYRNIELGTKTAINRGGQGSDRCQWFLFSFSPSLSLKN